MRWTGCLLELALCWAASCFSPDTSTHSRWPSDCDPRSLPLLLPFATISANSLVHTRKNSFDERVQLFKWIVHYNLFFQTCNLTKSTSITLILHFYRSNQVDTTKCFKTDLEIGIRHPICRGQITHPLNVIQHHRRHFWRLTYGTQGFLYYLNTWQNNGNKVGHPWIKPNVPKSTANCQLTSKLCSLRYPHFIVDLEFCNESNLASSNSALAV